MIIMIMRTVMMMMMILIAMVVITDDYDQDCTDDIDGYCILVLNISNSDYNWISTLIMMNMVMRSPH